MKKTLEYAYLAFFKTPQYLKSSYYSAFTTMNLTYALSGLIHALFILLFLFLGVRWLAIYNVISVLMWLIAFSLNRLGYIFLAAHVGFMEITMHAALCVYLLGWEAGFQYYVIPIIFGIFIFPKPSSYFKGFWIATLSMT